MTKLIQVLTVPQSLVFLKGQIGYMKARGLEIMVVSSPGDYLEQFAAQEQVAFKAVAMTRKVTPFRDLLALFRLYLLFRSEKPDIVHGSTPKAGFLSMLAAKLAGVPVRVYTARGVVFEGFDGGIRSCIKRVEWATCRLAHKVIAISRSVADLLTRERICPEVKIQLIANGSSNGVNPQKFNPCLAGRLKRDRFRRKYGIPVDAVVIGFVGRIVRSKGIHELFEAWEFLKAESSSVHLLIVGAMEGEDPVDRSVLDRMTQDPRVSITGHLEDVVPAYGVMDLLVLPTYREGFGNVIIEAGAMGLPVVATNVTGCVDSVESGKTGILVPAKDASALATAIRAYLCDSGMRRNHGKAARERVLRCFRPGEIWEGIYRIYCDLMDEKNGVLLSKPCAILKDDPSR